MAVNIKNKTNRPVMLRLNSGRTFYLNAEDITAEILDVEVSGNPKLLKLQARNIIELQEMKKKIKIPANVDKKKPKRKKK